MTETTTEQAVGSDRAAIRAALDATTTQYRAAVEAIPAADWKARSGNPGWTRGQLAWHVAASGDFVAGLVENARKGKGTNVPAFAMPLLFKLSELRVRMKSRGATPESVLRDYDAGSARVSRLLDSLRDDEFAMSATNFGETRTIAEMFQLPVEHMAEHGPEMARNR